MVLALKPGGFDILCRFHEICLGNLGTQSGQIIGISAGMAADNQHQIHFFGQLKGCFLSPFYLATYGIDNA
jgi:hypothetical protein